MSTHDQYMTRRQARDLARRLARLERKTRSTAAAHADLRHSSVDGGVLKIKDADGNTAYELGTDPATGVTAPQYRGGPVPEQPSEPFVDVGGEVVKIQHSGLDANENPAPADFRRAQIHVSQDEVFEPDFSTLAGYLEEADGSFTHRLPGGEWYVGVVWETLSGKISVMSGTVLADIPPLVDAQDIEDTLAEAEQIIADAVAEAQTQLDTLRDRLDNFEEYDPSDLIAQINQVTDDLADARQEAAGLVSDLADRVDDIKIPDVSGFITQAEVDAAATAAETAAKEHADLVAQGAKDEAIAEAETKANAAREAAEQAAKAYTDQQDIETLEAAAEDATAKANAAQSAAEAEAERLAKAEAQAAEAEAIRVAAADALAQANAARDDAIESASDDASAKAEAAREAAETYAEAEAQAKADAAQAEAIRQAKEDATAKADAAKDAAEQAAKDYADQQDAILKGEAAADAQAKADAVADELHAALQDIEQDYSKVWRQDSLPPAGTTYEWAGGRHASESIKRVDGDIAARSVQVAAPQLLEDGRSLRLDFPIPEDADTYQWRAEFRSTEPREGYDEAGFHATFTGPETTRGLAARFPADGEWQEYGRAYTVDPEATTGHIAFLVGNLTSPWYEIRRLQITFYADAGWPDYFDGDTPDDRANDLWYNAEGVPHEWVNGEGWVELTDARITDLIQATQAAQARADEAHAEAGSAWAQADAAMTLAGEAKTDAIEEAGRLATAAREAAEAEAGRLAKAEAQAAQTEAIRQAKADALAQAEAARDAAIESSSGDATAKADAAREAAEEYAEAEAQAKADAAQAEAIRQAALDATAKANAAQTAAENNAKQHADNLPKMLGGSGGPVGTAPNGSIWFRRDSNNTVIGRWERINGSWVQQEVSGQMIDNLEAGKITALNTEFAESVIGKLWTQLAIVDRLIATSAWIGGAMIGDDAVEAKHVVASETLSGKIAEFLKLSVADLTAGTAEIDDAVVNKFWSALAVIERLRAAEAWVTGDLVVDETIYTRHLRVTEDMVGEFASFLHLVVDRIDVNALWADQTWQTEGYFGAVEGGQQNLIDGRGMIVRQNPDGEDERILFQAGLYGEQQIASYDSDGNALYSLNEDGSAAVQSLDVTSDPSFAGKRLLGESLERFQHPSGDQSVLGWMPRGVLAHHRVSFDEVTLRYRQWGFMEVSHHMEAGRMYKLSVSPVTYHTTDGANAALRVRTADANVWLDDDIIGETTALDSTTNDQRTLSGSWIYQPETSGERPFLVELYSSARVRAPAGQTIHLWVEDLGVAPGSTGRARNSLADPTAGGAPIDDSAGQKQTYTTTWRPDWVQAYSHGGYRQATDSWRNRLIQGYWPAKPDAEDWTSIVGFAGADESTSPSEMGKTIAAALAGSDVIQISIHLKKAYAYRSTGTVFRVHRHGATEPANRYLSTPLLDTWIYDTQLRRGESRRTYLDVETYGPLLKSGAMRGLGLARRGEASTLYTGNLGTDGIEIQITYRR